MNENGNKDQVMTDGFELLVENDSDAAHPETSVDSQKKIAPEIGKEANGKVPNPEEGWNLFSHDVFPVKLPLRSAKNLKAFGEKKNKISALPQTAKTETKKAPFEGIPMPIVVEMPLIDFSGQKDSAPADNLPLAEGKHEEQFFDGCLKNEELQQIDRRQSDEAARLEAEEKRLAEIRLELIEKENELEYLQNSLTHRHWDFQNFFGAKLRRKIDENKALRMELKQAQEQAAKSGVQIVQVIEALNARAEAKCKEMLKAKQLELDEKVEAFAKAHRELMIEKDAAKAFRSKLKSVHEKKLAAETAKLQKEKQVYRDLAGFLKCSYKEKLANKIAEMRESVPAAASLPMPLADALLNAQQAENPLPGFRLPMPRLVDRVDVQPADVQPPAKHVPQPPPLPAANPVKFDDEKIPTWQIAVGTGAIGCIIFFAFKLFIM